MGNAEKNRISTFPSDPLENMSENTNEKKLNCVILPKDEVEISAQDLQLDDHHTRKCGEIVLDTFDNTFSLNCSLCSTICWDLIKFSEHVKKQHDSLIRQRTEIKVEKEQPVDAEEPFKVDNLNLRSTNVMSTNVVDVTHNIQNSEFSPKVKEENYNSGESVNETANLEIESDNHASNDSRTDSSTESNMETDNAEIDLRNHAVVAYFIKLLKQKPFLWNTAHPHRKRKTGLISLIDPLNKKFPRLTFTYKNLFTLLRDIRSAYQNELKQIKDTKSRGFEYTPQLWFFDKLKFVENMNDEAVSIQQKIDDFKKIAEQLPLNIYKVETVDSEMIKLEIINHFKEQPHLWSINHPEYSGKLQNAGLEKFYEFLCPKYKEITELTQLQFKKAFEDMLKWFTAIEGIRLHMEKSHQPFHSYYPHIYEALDFLRGHVPPFRCHICKKTFYDENKYVHHKEQCDIVVHECKHCFKRFSHQFYLKQHMITHSNERPFVCKICGKGFGANRLLSAHTRRHETKDLKCDLCERTYRFAYLLREHQKSHLKVRDKECYICGKTFIGSKNLYQHRLSHSEEHNRTCNNCGKVLKATSMSAHRKACLSALLLKKDSTKLLKLNY